MQVRVCGKCKQENAPVAVHCNKCGAILGEQRMQEYEARLAKLEAISTERLTLTKATSHKKRKKE